MPIVSKKIRKSAYLQDCTFEITGICNYNPETTVLCHLPDESGGMGKKSCDLSAAYGCYNCHQVIDRVVWNEAFEEKRDWYMRRAQTRTWLKLVELGIVVIK